MGHENNLGIIVEVPIIEGSSAGLVLVSNLCFLADSLLLQAIREAGSKVLRHLLGKSQLSVYRASTDRLLCSAKTPEI